MPSRPATALASCRSSSAQQRPNDGPFALRLVVQLHRHPDHLVALVLRGAPPPPTSRHRPTSPPRHALPLSIGRSPSRGLWGVLRTPQLEEEASSRAPTRAAIGERQAAGWLPPSRARLEVDAAAASPRERRWRPAGSGPVLVARSTRWKSRRRAVAGFPSRWGSRRGRPGRCPRRIEGGSAPRNPPGGL